MSISARTSVQRRRSISLGGRRGQRGVVLMIMLTFLVLWGLNLFLGQLNAAQFGAVRAQKSASGLAEAKEVLVGDAVSKTAVNSAAYLRLPDIGQQIPTGPPTEGIAAMTFSVANVSVLGKFPWKTLGLPAVRDGGNECLWYVVSGRFKIAPPATPLNWDTQGQINVADGNGNVLATNVAALLVAPGSSLDGQNRSLADSAYSECGGNYDGRNYLDSFNAANAISGEVNYFVGSTNNRLAPNADNKRFIMAKNDHYNDQFLTVSVDDIFGPIIKRGDFKSAVRSLLDKLEFQSLPIDGSKGTDNLNCGSDNFCRNWKEMLFLTQLAAPTTITIQGLPSPTPCNRVLIFAGKKGPGQSRNPGIEQSDKNNYLEGSNASSFVAPVSSATAFSGAADFDWRRPDADVVKCVTP